MNRTDFIRRLRLRRFAASTAAIVNIVTTFGALTAASAGGVAVSGTSISSGDASGHFQISGGLLTPSSAGDTADLGSGPYSLVLDNGQQITIGITSNEYSARTEAELQTAATAATGGETIRLRNTGSMISSASLQIASGKTYTTHLNITGEAGAKMQRIQLRNSVKVRIHDLEFYDSTGSTSVGQVGLLGACDQYIIEDCTFHGLPLDVNGDYTSGYTNTGFAINTGEVGGNQPLGGIIRRNNCYDLRAGIVVTCEGGSELTVTDNKVHRTWTDCMQFAFLDGSQSTTKTISRNLLRDLVGKSSDAGAPHQDAIQFSASEANFDLDMLNLEMRQNVIIQDGSTRSDEMAGIVSFADATQGPRWVDPVIAGNIILLKGTNPLTFERINGGTFVNNTLAVTELGVTPNGTATINIGDSTIGSTSSEGTIYVHRNICEAVSLQGGATYDQGTGDDVNVILGDEGATNSYASVFDGPFTDPTSFANAKTRFSRKASGPADNSGMDAGALGSGYGTFGNELTSTGWTYDSDYETVAYVRNKVDNAGTAAFTKSGGLGSGTETAFTFACWITPQGVSGLRALFHVDARIQVFISGDEIDILLKDTLNSTRYSGASTSNVFSTGTEVFLYIAADYDNDTLVINVDGSEPTLSSATSGFTGGSGQVPLNRNTGILSNSGGAAIFDTIVSDVLLYNSIVSEASIYNSGTPPDPATVGSPLLLLGSAMTADSGPGGASEGWNDGHNEGSGGALTVVSADFTDV